MHPCQKIGAGACSRLGGQTWQLPRGMSVSGLDNIVAIINSNYENGAIDNGYLH